MDQAMKDKEVTDLTTEDLDNALNKRALVVTFDDETGEVEVDWERFNELEVTR